MTPPDVATRMSSTLTITPLTPDRIEPMTRWNWEVAVVTPGTERFHSLFSLTFDQVYRVIRLNQWKRVSPIVITWTGPWRHDTFEWHDRSGLVQNLVFFKNVPNSKSWLSCNGQDYSLVSENPTRKLKIFERISTFHCRERQSVRWAAYQWIEKFRAAVKEIKSLNWKH